MKFVTRFTTLLTLLALGACGGGSDDVALPDNGGGNNNPPPPVVTAPAITTQPASASANEGGTVTFTVVAAGDGLSYQWKRNGTAIAGATAASYTTSALAAGDDQSIYTVTVTNAGGSVTSNNATLAVTITTPPPTGGGDDDGPLQPLPGPTVPVPQIPAPIAATPAISGVSPNHHYLLTWDPSSNGRYTLGFLHRSGAESRLYVPVNAFLDDVFITTADVTDIGPAVTSVIAAIDIEPSDLVTEKTLTANFMIPDTMMATIDPAQLIGFAADADGSNLHLVPIVVGNFGASLSRPAIKLDHLGIVGIAVATPEQQAALAAAWPTDPDDRLIAALAPTLTAQWRAAVTPATATTAKTTRAAGKGIAAAESPENPAIAIIRGYYNDVVVPAFAAADADPSTALSAITVGLSFLRMAELSGESGTDGAFYVVAQQVKSRVDALFDINADYVAEQCRTIGGPVQRQQMLSAIRRLQLQGHQAKSGELEEILPQCSNYKITFRFDYTRTANWSTQYTAGDHTGIETREERAHAVVEGSLAFAAGDTPIDEPLRLTTLDWTDNRTRDNGEVFRATWESEGVTSPWRVNGISIPLVRTRGGTPPASMTMYLSPFIDVGPNSAVTFHPFSATVKTQHTDRNGSTSQLPDSVHTQVNMELFVPALPSNQQHNYGPMLIPPSGSATSQATRTIPYHGGSIIESESVTVTITRAE